MISVALQTWGQTLADLRRLAIEAAHPRTRERFLALSLIADGTHNASSFASAHDRQHETVMKWVHAYNQKGPDALTDRRTGSRAPFLPPTKPSNLSRP